MPEPNETVQPDLSLITGPVENPSKAPDDHTSREIRHAEMLGKLNPTQRQIHAIERHLAECTHERIRLTEESRTLRDELDNLRPKYSALKESHRNVGSNGTFAAICSAVGGVALGVAGFIPDTHAWLKWLLVGGGIVGTVLSIWQSVKTRIWLWPDGEADD